MEENENSLYKIENRNWGNTMKIIENSWNDTQRYINCKKRKLEGDVELWEEENNVKIYPKIEFYQREIPMKPLKDEELSEFTLEYLRNLEGYWVVERKEYVYYGQIIDGKRNGTGVWKYKSGRLYQGQFLNDLREGNGKEKFTNFHIYQGTYKQGKMHGKGVYLWPTGESYVGQWHQGVKHGYGKWKKGKNSKEEYVGNWSG